jgi:dephospho-CoA kinase
LPLQKLIGINRNRESQNKKITQRLGKGKKKTLGGFAQQKLARHVVPIKVELACLELIEHHQKFNWIENYQVPTRRYQIDFTRKFVACTDGAFGQIL